MRRRFLNLAGDRRWKMGRLQGPVFLSGSAHNHDAPASHLSSIGSFCFAEVELVGKAARALLFHQQMNHNLILEIQRRKILALGMNAREAKGQSGAGKHYRMAKGSEEGMLRRLHETEV